jgi:hypothetical protein
MDNELKAAELESLKTRADLLGVEYHPSIGADKLRQKIKDHEAAEATKTAASTPPATSEAEKPAVETEDQRRRRLRNECMKLVRVNITCMNPLKKEWQGEVFTVGNAAVGSVKRFVPYNTEQGWHVEQIILNVMRERVFPQYYTEKSVRGIDVRKSKLAKEFAIDVLPPLTEEEIQELAQRQAMSKSVG